MVRIVKRNRINIAILLLLIAVPLTNLIAVYANRDISILSDLFMMIVVLLLLNKGNLRRFNWIGKEYSLIYIYIIYSLFSAILVEYSFTKGAGAIIYSVYALILMYALGTNYGWDNSDSFVRILFHVTGILCFLCANVFTEGFTNFSNHLNSMYDDAGNVISNRVTLSALPVVNLLVSIAYTAKNRKEFLLKAFYMMMSALCLMITFRRGGTVSVGMALVAHYMYKIRYLGKIRRKTLIKGMLVAAFGIIMFAFLMRNQMIRHEMNRLVQSIKIAVNTLFGNISQGEDASAGTRNNLRMRAINEYPDYNFFQIIFGKGYMYNYLDFPILQAIIDLGWIGGSMFVFLQIIVPGQNFLQHPKSDLDEFLKLYSICGMTEAFYSGIPYSYSRFVFLYLILFYRYSSKMRLGLKEIE